MYSDVGGSIREPQAALLGRDYRFALDHCA
jgi:hypothetical protein